MTLSLFGLEEGKIYNTHAMKTRTTREVESWLEIESTQTVALWHSRRLYNLLLYIILLIK